MVWDSMLFQVSILYNLNLNINLSCNTEVLFLCNSQVTQYIKMTSLS